MLESEWDTWFLAKATAYGRRFFETESFKEIFDPDEVFPGLQTQTQEQWEQFITDNINIGVSLFDHYHEAESLKLWRIVPLSRHIVSFA